MPDDSAAASTPPPATDRGPLIEPTWLQVGAFSNSQRALEVQQALHQAGLDPVTIESSLQQGQGLHRVRIGPFRHERDVLAFASRITTLGFAQPVRISLQCQPQGNPC